jgi:mannan endo-1,6-alpha-mannosidase
LLSNFFPEKIAIEISCELERISTCTADMLSFKGYTHRWLAVVAQMAPFTAEKILPILRTSTQAAISQCTGGATGRRCGFYWKNGIFFDPAQDMTSGAGEQMNVLAAVSSLMVEYGAPVPVTAATGGISEGDINAGSSSVDMPEMMPITAGDRAGAGILTVLILICTLTTFFWMTFAA